jgi:hypothetical protein
MVPLGKLAGNQKIENETRSHKGHRAIDNSISRKLSHLWCHSSGNMDEGWNGLLAFAEDQRGRLGPSPLIVGFGIPERSDVLDDPQHLPQLSEADLLSTIEQNDSQVSLVMSREATPKTSISEQKFKKPKARFKRHDMFRRA